MSSQEIFFCRPRRTAIFVQKITRIFDHADGTSHSARKSLQSAATLNNFSSLRNEWMCSKTKEMLIQQLHFRCQRIMIYSVPPLRAGRHRCLHQIRQGWQFTGSFLWADLLEFLLCFFRVGGCQVIAHWHSLNCHKCDQCPRKIAIG